MQGRQPETNSPHPRYRLTLPAATFSTDFIQQTFSVKAGLGVPKNLARSRVFGSNIRWGGVSVAMPLKASPILGVIKGYRPAMKRAHRYWSHAAEPFILRRSGDYGLSLRKSGKSSGDFFWSGSFFLGGAPLADEVSFDGALVDFFNLSLVDGNAGFGCA